MPPSVTVVVCTYNRPTMLERAVMSCLENASPEGVSFEIVVADNSPDGHAAPLVARLSGAGFPVRRVAAFPPNISIARNAGLRAATAPLVAFLDDDLEVDLGWLDALLATMRQTGADVVLGRLKPRFALGGPPVWDPQALRFNRWVPFPSGTRLVAGGQHRTRGFPMTTATSLWRVATCFTDTAPFDVGFGVSGGEDFDLFLRLEARGCRFAWCADSVAIETIPAERSALFHNVLRVYSGSQAYASATIRNAGHPVLTAIDVMARGTLQSFAFGVSALLRRPFGGARWQRDLMAASGALGKLLWFRKLGFYRLEKAPSGA